MIDGTGGKVVRLMCFRVLWKICGRPDGYEPFRHDCDAFSEQLIIQSFIN